MKVKYLMKLCVHFNLHNICLTGEFNARTGSIHDCIYGRNCIESQPNPMVPDLVKDCLHCQTMILM